MSPVVRTAAAHGQTAEHIVGHPQRLGLDLVVHVDVGRIVALQAQRRFFFRHFQMAVEKFAPFFFVPAGVDAGEERTDGVGVGVPAPAGVIGFGGLVVFQVGHELAADLRVLREQVAELSGRARVIFGGSFAQQRQKGMQFCARCAIINAIIQQEGSLCESLSKLALPHWRTRPDG